MTFGVKEILVHMGEECKVDVKQLHNSLLSLPADKYLHLYKLMRKKIDDVKYEE